MKYVLLPEHRAELVRFAAAPTLAAFDFDGTLAPITPFPEEARLRPRTAELLTDVCARYPSALLTGRALLDIAPRLPGVALDHLIGNHGIEPSPEEERCRAFTREAFPVLERELAGFAGIELEDKLYSISVHYRHTADHALALRAIEAAIASLPERPRAIGGKCVVSLTVEGAPDKGTALARLVAQEGVEHALYVGDDDTDEDVFRSSIRGLMGIRVGFSEASAAPYFLREQEEIDQLLELLIAARAQRRR